MSDLVQQMREKARGSMDAPFWNEAANRVERLQNSFSRCLLCDPPGDCYAAEAVALRAEVARLDAANVGLANESHGLQAERDAATEAGRIILAEVKHWQTAYQDTLKGGDVLKAELERLRAERDALRAVYEAASGVCRGVDWNKGTHAKAYRKKLIDAVAAVAAREGEG